MARQLVTLDPRERKRLYDRVQVLTAEDLPVIFRVSPNILAGAGGWSTPASTATGRRHV